MADTAGTFVFVATDGSKTYSVDAFVPDAVATTIKFNASGKALTTSPEYWQAPEDVYLVDITGVAPTAVGGVVTFTGSIISGKTFRWANQLASLATRMKHKVLVRAGTQFGILQH